MPMTPWSSVRPRDRPPQGRVSGDCGQGQRGYYRWRAGLDSPHCQGLRQLATPILVVHKGALFEGHCTMNAEPKEDRKVTPIAPKEERVIPRAAVAGNKLA
jgi:hypothetical protein